jgi:hypothetical protein
MDGSLERRAHFSYIISQLDKSGQKVVCYLQTAENYVTLKKIFTGFYLPDGC